MTNTRPGLIKRKSVSHHNSQNTLGDAPRTSHDGRPESKPKRLKLYQRTKNILTLRHFRDKKAKGDSGITTASPNAQSVSNAHLLPRAVIAEPPIPPVGAETSEIARVVGNAPSENQPIPQIPQLHKTASVQSGPIIKSGDSQRSSTEQVVSPGIPQRQSDDQNLEGSLLLYRCPFHKHNAEEFEACVHLLIPDMGSLLSHLRASHSNPNSSFVMPKELSSYQALIFKVLNADTSDQHDMKLYNDIFKLISHSDELLHSDQIRSNVPWSITMSRWGSSTYGSEEAKDTAWMKLTTQLVLRARRVELSTSTTKVPSHLLPIVSVTPPPQNNPSRRNSTSSGDALARSIDSLSITSQRGISQRPLTPNAGSISQLDSTALSTLLNISNKGVSRKSEESIQLSRFYAGDLEDEKYRTQGSASPATNGSLRGRASSVTSTDLEPDNTYSGNKSTYLHQGESTSSPIQNEYNNYRDTLLLGMERDIRNYRQMSHLSFNSGLTATIELDG